MTITNRDELIEAWKLRGLQGASIEQQADWLSEQGFALVPLEPNSEVMNAVVRADERETKPGNLFGWAKAIAQAANEAGNLLKRRDG